MSPNQGPQDEGPDSEACEPVLQGATKDLFVNTERLAIGVFTVDYLLRFFTAHATRHFEFVAPPIIEYYLKMDGRDL